tara:strand:- start:132 stop:260 length:129 start_codon:yes stop_codon:yes gene_type:complete
MSNMQTEKNSAKGRNSSKISSSEIGRKILKIPRSLGVLTLEE